MPTRRPTTALVVTGPYRFSRNPIYVGMILLLLGAGVMVDAPWLIALAVPFALVLRYGVIAREERYLEAKFGDGYGTYRARAPLDLISAGLMERAAHGLAFSPSVSA